MEYEGRKIADLPDAQLIGIRDKMAAQRQAFMDRVNGAVGKKAEFVKQARAEPSEAFRNAERAIQDEVARRGL